MKHMEECLRIGKGMSAQHLDALISALAEIRVTKQPPVSSKRPDPSDASSMDTPVTVEDSPALMAKALTDGRVRLWARSSGFGWLAFNITNQEAIALRDWFSANVEGDSTLFSQQSGHRH